MKHRHDRQRDRVRRHRQAVDPAYKQRMQHVRAMRVEHALRVARGARRVAEPGGGALVELGPAEVPVDLGQPILVGDGVSQGCRRQMGRVGQHDVTLDRRQFVLQRLQQRQEGQIGEHRPVFGVIDDPGDLLGKQARIDGVIDRADARDPVPALEMTVRVPGQGRHAIAELDPVPRQPLRHAQRARPHRPVGRAVDRTLDQPGDHLLPAMLHAGEIDDLVEQQRPFLHLAQHRDPP